MIKFAIVEDHTGRRVVSQFVKDYFDFKSFLHRSNQYNWLPRNAFDNYLVKKFSRKEVIIEKLPSQDDFALEIQQALNNYGFNGVLTFETQGISR